MIYRSKTSRRVTTCISNEPNPPSESRIFIKPSSPPIIDSINDSTYRTASRPIFVTYIHKVMDYGLWFEGMRITEWLKLFINTSSGTTGEAHSGKLLATPSQAQQCCGRPSGPNMVLRKTYRTHWVRLRYVIFKRL